MAMAIRLGRQDANPSKIKDIKDEEQAVVKWEEKLTVLMEVHTLSNFPTWLRWEWAVSSAVTSRTRTHLEM